MELKVTTLRALAFEEATGKDMLEVLQEVEKTNQIKLKDIISLFIACGEGYDAEMFDEWDEPFMDKVSKVMNAVGQYFGAGKKGVGKKSKK